MSKLSEIHRTLRFWGYRAAHYENQLLDTLFFKFLRIIGNGSIFITSLINLRNFIQQQNKVHSIIHVINSQTNLSPPLSTIKGNVLLNWLFSQTTHVINNLYIYQELPSQIHNVLDKFDDLNRRYSILYAVNYFFLYEIPLFLLGTLNRNWGKKFFDYIEGEFQKELMNEFYLEYIIKKLSNSDQEKNKIFLEELQEIRFDSDSLGDIKTIDREPFVYFFQNQSISGYQDIQKGFNEFLEKLITQVNQSGKIKKEWMRAATTKQNSQYIEKIYQSLKQSKSALMDYRELGDKFWYITALIGKCVGSYIAFKSFYDTWKTVIKNPWSKSKNLLNFIHIAIALTTDFTFLIGSISKFMSPIVAIAQHYSAIKKTVQERYRSAKYPTNKAFTYFIFSGTFYDFLMQFKELISTILYINPALSLTEKEKLLTILNYFWILSGQNKSNAADPVTEYCGNNCQFTNALRHQISTNMQPLSNISCIQNLLHLSHVSSRTVQRASQISSDPIMNAKAFINHHQKTIESLFGLSSKKISPSANDKKLHNQGNKHYSEGTDEGVLQVLFSPKGN